MYNNRSALISASIAALSIVSLNAGSASAAIFSQRDTTYYIDVSGGLNSAVTQYDNTITLPAGGTNAIGTSLNFRVGATGTYISTTGGVATTMSPPAFGTPVIFGDITNDGSGGAFKFGYQTTNGPDFATSWTKSEVMFGHNVLHFNGGGTGFLDAGGIFVDNIFITGDWSGLGTNSGNHTGLTFSSGYSVINDFVYDPMNNWTLLTISTGAFDGLNPGIDFFLIGSSAVPEPSTWALMLAGFGLVGATLRRRSATA